MTGAWRGAATARLAESLTGLNLIFVAAMN
jgi:hypothetical protein